MKAQDLREVTNLIEDKRRLMAQREIIASIDGIDVVAYAKLVKPNNNERRPSRSPPPRKERSFKQAIKLGLDISTIRLILRTQTDKDLDQVNEQLKSLGVED